MVVAAVGEPRSISTACAAPATYVLAVVVVVAGLRLQLTLLEAQVEVLLAAPLLGLEALVAQEPYLPLEVVVREVAPREFLAAQAALEVVGVLVETAETVAAVHHIPRVDLVGARAATQFLEMATSHGLQQVLV